MNKHLLIVLVIVLNSSFVFSQVGEGARTGRDPQTPMSSVLADFNKANSAHFDFSKKLEIEIETITLFNEWDNTNIVRTNDNVKFKLKNINIDIEKNKFVFKDDKTVYFYDFTNLNYIVINNKKFRTYHFENKNTKKILEVINESKNISLLKEYEVHFKQDKVNALMMIGNSDNYTIRDRYYVKNNNEIKRIRLKKKSILSVLIDKKDLITKFVKKHKLSYNDERDVKEIFNYYARI